MNHLVLLLALAGCRNDTGVTTFNANPDAEITSHSDGEEVLEGYTENFRGAVSDSDNSTEELTATWFVDGEVACDAATQRLVCSAKGL